MGIMDTERQPDMERQPAWDNTAIALALKTQNLSRIYSPHFEWGDSLVVGPLEDPAALELYPLYRALRINTLDSTHEFLRIREVEISPGGVHFYRNRGEGKQAALEGVLISHEGSVAVVHEPAGSKLTAGGLTRETKQQSKDATDPTRTDGYGKVSVIEQRKTRDGKPYWNLELEPPHRIRIFDEKLLNGIDIGAVVQYAEVQSKNGFRRLVLFEPIFASPRLPS